MLKNILLLTLISTSILSKDDSQSEFIAKLQKMDKVNHLIKQKERNIDHINEETVRLFTGVVIADEVRVSIFKEANKFEQKLVEALDKNKEIESLLKENLCPDITICRNEINRLKEIVVQICMEYFFMHHLWQLYTELAMDALKIQNEIKK